MIEQVLLITNNNKKLLVVVLIAYLIDFITGTSKAILNKNFKSSKFRNSVLKGITYFSYIIIAFCLEYVLNLQGAVFMVCCYLALTEFISVIENMKEFGKFPNNIFKNLTTIKNSYDEEVDEETNKTEENIFNPEDILI